MKLQVIVDNKSAVEGFATEWGFACMIGEDLLFDTGTTPEVLFGNLAQAGIKPENLKMVALSHADGDHTGGLMALIERNPEIEVVIHTTFTPGLVKQLRESNARLTLADTFTELSPGVHVTGPYPTREQALVIQTKTGLVIVTGCAHPDPVEILENIKKNMTGTIELMFGGMHLNKQTEAETLKTIADFRRLDVKKAGPCHCTGENAIQLFKEEYGDDFLEIAAGTTLQI